MGKVKILSQLFLVKVMDRCPCCPLPSGYPYHLWVARQALPAPSGASCHLQWLRVLGPSQPGTARSSRSPADWQLGPCYLGAEAENVMEVCESDRILSLMVGIGRMSSKLRVTSHGLLHLLPNFSEKQSDFLFSALFSLFGISLVNFLRLWKRLHYPVF